MMNSAGRLDYEAIARQGHDKARKIQSSSADLIQLRHRADLDLTRPSEEEVALTKDRTAKALASIQANARAASAPNSNSRDPTASTFCRYVPTHRIGRTADSQHERLVKIVKRQQDPMEPPEIKIKRIPRGPPSPPPPIIRSPPRQSTAEEQKLWQIPPPIRRRNPEAFTIPLADRLNKDGRGLEDTSKSDNYASLAEALHLADHKARREVLQRALIQQKLAERDKLRKEEELRQLAQQARTEHHSWGAKRRRRIHVESREQDRDIPGKGTLGLAGPTDSHSAYDSRLFNQSSSLISNHSEYQPYDKPLFAERDALASIYRPQLERHTASKATESLLDCSKEKYRFEVLGKAKTDITGTKPPQSIARNMLSPRTLTLGQARQGPVQFEKGDEVVPWLP